MSSEKRDYYEVLGVERDADAATLKKAFRKQAIKFHPDRNDAPEAEDKFKEINEAYAVLSDGEKRARYDRFGHDAPGASPFGGGGFNPHDIFEQIFGAFGGSRRGARHGNDVRMGLVVTLDEVAKGAEKKVTFRRPCPCSNCNGTGAHPDHPPVSCRTCGGVGRVRINSFLPLVQACPACNGAGKTITKACPKCHSGLVEEEVTLTVPVPAGVASGLTLRMDGEGGHGKAGGLPGDLYLDIEVEAHPFFSRNGDDLICEVPISFPQAAMGASITVPTLDGKARVKVPAGTQSGKTLRLRGKGLPPIQGRGVGDQLVRLQIETPQKLTSRQKDLLEEFEKISDEVEEGGQPKRRSFLDAIKDLFD